MVEVKNCIASVARLLGLRIVTTLIPLVCRKDFERLSKQSLALTRIEDRSFDGAPDRNAIACRSNHIKQDLPPHGMFPTGEKVQIEDTLTSLWFIQGGFGIYSLVICHSSDQILVLTLILGW